MGAPVSITSLATANVATEHQVVKFPTKEQFSASAGHKALEDMRQQLGRSSAASHWSHLSVRARSMICYAAKLRPSTYATRELDEMTVDEREAVRVAILELRAISNEFGPAMLDRAEFARIGEQQKADDPDRAKRELMARCRLNQQARSLQHRMDAMQAATPKT